MDDKRSSLRRRVLKAGTIVFGGGGISCTVRNLSASGAALDVASPMGIPEQFELMIETDALARPCHVIWRKEKRIGIAFRQGA
ncbi:PilZ domain-containing protein [Rhodopseudomonas palustris]|uniref:Type IV pilus assembly PilZ n=1 Tax=Rhodopseudomonas palustris (strain BisB18) TaxID=316056 RepID=Q218S5_RHOPB